MRKLELHSTFSIGLSIGSGGRAAGPYRAPRVLWAAVGWRRDVSFMKLLLFVSLSQEGFH